MAVVAGPGTGKTKTLVSRIAWLVEPLAKAAVAAGADGLMIEVHNDPKRALCDGAQSLTPEAFRDVMEGVRAVLPHAWHMPKEGV